MHFMVQRYIAGLGALFFGEDDIRPAEIGGAPAYLEDWGGASVDDHHTFIVRYRPDEDRHLDMHVDECAVTLPCSNSGRSAVVFYMLLVDTR